MELYMYAGAPRPALHLLNHQLSDLVEPALDDRVAGERGGAPCPCSCVTGGRTRPHDP